MARTVDGPALGRWAIHPARSSGGGRHGGGSTSTAKQFRATVHAVPASLPRTGRGIGPASCSGRCFKQRLGQWFIQRLAHPIQRGVEGGARRGAGGGVGRRAGLAVCASSGSRQFQLITCNKFTLVPRNQPLRTPNLCGDFGLRLPRPLADGDFDGLLDVASFEPLAVDAVGPQREPKGILARTCAAIRDGPLWIFQPYAGRGGGWSSFGRVCRSDAARSASRAARSKISWTPCTCSGSRR